MSRHTSRQIEATREKLRTLFQALDNEGMAILYDEARQEAARRMIREHGVIDGDWHEPRNREYKRASGAYESEISSRD